MKKIHQKDVHIISRHSNLTKDEVGRILKENVYHNKEAWYTFFRYFLISLGVGFTVSGIVFFFAYNWADLHKFAKIGLTEGMLLATVVIVLLVKMNDQIRNIVLTGASVLVGVLFAVFGQIYQTGADAYDFFLAWTLFITLWVCVAHFAPLWLLYLVLINTTLLLYTQQVAQDWSVVFICFFLFSINTTVVLAATFGRKHAIPNLVFVYRFFSFCKLCDCRYYFGDF